MPILLESPLTVDVPAFEFLGFPAEELTYEPSPDDLAWLARTEEEDDLIEQARLEAAMLDHLDELHFGDDELSMYLAGHPVG